MNQSIRIFCLDGKDYLDEQEAAHYTCLGLTKFREWTKLHGVKPGLIDSKKLYRKSDLQRLIEREGFNHGTDSNNIRT